MKKISEISIIINMKPTIWLRICDIKLGVMERFNPIGAFVFSEQLVQDIQKHPARYFKVKHQGPMKKSKAEKWLDKHMD